MSLRKGEKKSETEKTQNYKNLITQYYDHDPHLSDIYERIKIDAPEI
jgi:hypothetical protein